MSGLEDIALRPEKVYEPDSATILHPVLHEIRHALRRLIQNGESTVIDLTSLPFGPGDERQLLEYLGEGEVNATLNTLGRSRLWETRFPGVWLVDHYNPEQVRIAFQIEVGEVPAVLKSQKEDVADGLDRLTNLLR
jgi:hydrogenase-1 operon protein HyaF